MTVMLTLLAVATVTWGFRITFTALVAADRLPASVRSRMDAVGAAAFAALLATQLSETSRAALPAMVGALAAAAVAARLTKNHLAAVAVGAATWALISVL